ncbi:hypothetical protein [Metabacillus malikii]|uniref:Permease n=1 Tax=Metabacillus malikii TaxID=1504265 RepID=A0ABT9ZJK8_9BACI|nr:hypothetical protein [Metabacillus malikii]MDQ0232084.1 hypothetical protein [Metabacillus malikii]
MKNKQRQKAALQQKRKKERALAGKTRQNNKDDSSSQPLLTSITLTLLLLIGWYCLTNHLEETIHDAGYEPALAEPYYQILKTISILYWVIGIASIIGTLLVNKIHKPLSHFFLFVIGMLAGLGIFATLPIALIKLHVPMLAIILTIFFVIGLTIHFILNLNKDVPTVLKFASGFFVIFAILSLVFLIIAEPTDGNYLMISKGSATGNFFTKFFTWIIGMGGLLYLLIFIMLKSEDVEPLFKKRHRE